MSSALHMQCRVTTTTCLEQICKWPELTIHKIAVGKCRSCRLAIAGKAAQHFNADMLLIQPTSCPPLTVSLDSQALPQTLCCLSLEGTNCTLTV